MQRIRTRSNYIKELQKRRYLGPMSTN